MLLRRILIPLRLQHGQRLDQLLPRLPRLDDCIHKAAVRGHIRVGEAFAEFVDLLATKLFPIRRRVEFPLVHDVDRALRPHHRNLGGRPYIIHIRADVLRRHHAIGPTVRLARDHRNLRNRSLGKRE